LNNPPRSLKLLAPILLAPIAFVLSSIFLSYCIEGDQVAYRKLYEALSEAILSDAVDISVAYTSGAEPLTAIILWVGAYLGVPKDVYISIINTIFVISLYLFARKNQVSMSMIFLFLTNFYIIVLISFAERLKISYLFLILAGLTVGRIRTFLLFSALLSHFQSIIILFCFGFSYLCGFIKNFFSINDLKKLLIILILSAGILFLNYDYILIKINAYAGSGDLLEILKLICLLAIPLYVTSRPYKMAVTIFPLLPSVAIIGGTRINMIAFTIAIYFLIKERRMSHPLVYLLMLYFSLKSLFFIEEVILTGQGF
jgi:hypothetical protein